MRTKSAMALAILLAAAFLAGSRTAVAAGPDGAWVQLEASATGPFGRNGTSATFDSRRGRAIVLGGSFSSFYHGPIRGYDAKTWAFDLRDTAGWTSIASPASTPAALECVAVAYDSLADRVWAFGGAHYDAFTSALDRLDGTLHWLDAASPGDAWDSVATPAVAPAPRQRHTMILDAPRRRLIVFGGRGGDGHVLGDVWTYDLDGAGGWTQLASSGPAPVAREGHAAVIDPLRDRMLVFAGSDESGAALGDAWALDLGAAPAWTPLAATGSAPAGPVPAVYDPRDDRVLVLGGDRTNGVAVFELALAPAPTWRRLAPAGITPGRVNDRFAAVLDPLTHRVADLGSDSYSFPAYESRWLTDILHLDPLPPAQLTATLAPPRYASQATTLDWQVALAGPLYEPIALERVDGAGVTTIGAARPDPTGSLHFVDWGLVAGRHYDYRLRWFDGAAPARTPDTGVDTPPAPVSLAVSLDSLYERGDLVNVQWSVPDDSATWLAPMGLERSLDGGPWERVSTMFPELGHVSLATNSLPPETEVRHRLTWGPNIDDHASPAVGLTTLPVPVLKGSAANGAGAIVEWQYPPGRALTATASILYYNGWGPIDTLEADAAGVLHLDDPNVSPGNFASYRLGWDVGGATRFSPQVDVVIDFQNTGLLRLLAADSAAVTLTWSYPDYDTLRILTLERRESAGWSTLANLAPALPAVRRYVDHTAQPRAHYEYRVRWPVGGVELHSEALAVDVGGGPAPIPTPVFALERILPNPAANGFDIAFSLPDSRSATLQLVAVSGRRVSGKEVAGTGPHRVHVETAGLAAGVYLVELSHPAGKRVERVVVLR